MDIHNYKTDSLADAFEMASKDTKTWDFPAMEALAELAENAHAGTLDGMRMGLGTIYACTQGQFKVNVDSNKGYGIALLSLTGRESGIDDPTAAEILEYHRDRPEEELYADQLLVFPENVPDINALDTGYELLLRAQFLVGTNSTVQVTVDEATVERPKYRLRRSMEMIDQQPLLDPSSRGTLKMVDVRVHVRSNEDGSAVAELVNRDDLIAILQRTSARDIQEEKPPPIKPYDPTETDYSDNPPPPTSKDFEYLRADYSDDERVRLRTAGRIPREITIPAKAMEYELAEDVVRRELAQALPVSVRDDVKIVIET